MVAQRHLSPTSPGSAERSEIYDRWSVSRKWDKQVVGWGKNAQISKHIRWSIGWTRALNDDMEVVRLSPLQNKAKSRTAVWLYPETMKRMDDMLEKDNVKNRSEFIEKALQFYMSYLNSEGSTEYMSKVIVTTMQGLLRETESRHSGNLFRLSVEMSMMMNILAAGLEISDEDLRKLRGRCVNEVKKTKGKISIEEAVKFQQGIEE